MRLIDLTEERSRVFYRENGDNYGYYASKSAGVLPFVVVIDKGSNTWQTVVITKDGKTII